MKAFPILLLLPILCVPVCFAQDGAVEEIVVTGLRSSGYDDVPAISYRKKADYLVQKVKLVNDSRSPELRKTEIIQSIKNLMSSAKNIKGIELAYGEGFLVPIRLDDDSLQLIEDRKISDTSYVNISIKVLVDQKKSAKLQIAELKKFVRGTKLVGRTEIEEQNDIGLSIINPEQYRYDILSLVAKENGKLKTTFGQDCKITSDGLAGRVEWDRTAVDELTLYIRYSTSISCK